MILKLLTDEEQFFKESFSKNFPSLKHYFNIRPKIFLDLVFNISEINRCLILESYTASITLTNHMLERLFKLALVEDELEVGPVTNPWEKCYERMHRYLNMNMDKTINLCFEKQLITENQKKEVKRYKDIFRNGFSHGDLDKIFMEYPETYQAYTATEVYTLNLKKDPRQMYHLNKFAEKYAIEYFEFVISLINIIEKNLINKYPNSYNVINILKREIVP
jgi:hypothetical protein